MVFASHTFILFLFTCLFVYWAAGFRVGAGRFILIAFSLVFFAYWIPVYLFILIGSILANFGLGSVLLRVRNRRHSAVLVALGVAGNLLLIGYYKYFAFLVASLNYFVEPPLPVPDILLPIGISFFTFQQVGFLVDLHRGRVGELRFWDYVLFVSFFPQLIAGPIVTQGEMLPQLARRREWRLDAAQVAVGFAIFSIGLFKKSVLIDPFVPFIDLVYTAAASGQPMGFVDGWFAGIGYGFQIYFDFSGYSDMAIGLALMFGLKLPVNFFSPYRAASVREFWRRWHITLSRYLRDYVFIPLGGSRHGLPHTVAALTVTMGLGGLWHGAGWTFVIWGLLHGGYLAVNHIARRFVPRLNSPYAVQLGLRGLSVLLTFLAVSFAWVFFRAEDMASATSLASAMLGGGEWHTVAPLGRGIIFLFPVYFAIVWLMPNTLQIFRRFAPALHAEQYHAATPITPIERWLWFDFSNRWAITTGCVFIVAWLALTNLSPFIYFQF